MLNKPKVMFNFSILDVVVFVKISSSLPTLHYVSIYIYIYIYIYMFMYVCVYVYVYMYVCMLNN